MAIPGVVAYSGKTSGQVDADQQGASYCIRNLAGGSYILTAYGAAEYETQSCTLSVGTDKVVVRDFALTRRPVRP
jgi:hypothetical protein